jgi:replicative DNA helicase
MQGQDTLEKYGQSFQTKVISSLLTDVRILDNLNEIIHQKFFESDVNKWIVSEIVDYYNDYRRIPTVDVFKVKVSELDDKGFQKRIVDQLKSAYQKLETSDLDYIKQEFSNFCINQNLKQAIVDSVDLLKAGNYDSIKDKVDKAMKIGIDSDLGHDYILDYQDRTDIINRNTVPTDWDALNDVMDGGLGPGELGVVVAPSGVGKTWVLCALGAAAIRQGKTVVHYSLELSEHYVGQRYDTIFTQIPSNQLIDKKEEVFTKISKLPGKLQIKYFPPKGITVKKLQAHIEKMIAAGNKPDIIILDYADLLLSYTNKSDSTYQEQGGTYIELRGMGGELEIPVWTASQTNRSAIDSEVIEADKISDSYAKVMNADFIMSLSRKSKDKLNNTARAHIMKNRFGPDGITFPCKMDTNVGIMEVYDGNSSDGIIATKESKNGEEMERKLLHKKYVENLG